MVKVISLSNEAYEKLKSKKTSNKSFSDVVIELVEDRKKGSILDLFGILKEDDDFIKHVEEAIKDRKNIKLRDVRF